MLLSLLKCPLIWTFFGTKLKKAKGSRAANYVRNFYKGLTKEG